MSTSDAMPDYHKLFLLYVSTYNRSLGAEVDKLALRQFFAEAFVSAGVHYEVSFANNDESFDRMLVKGYTFYRAIGTKSMQLDRVEVTPIYEGHDCVRVFYVAEYQKKDGAPVTIPFDVAYILQRRDAMPKIIAFIAGDEMGLYHQYGLVDAAGLPV